MGMMGRRGEGFWVELIGAKRKAVECFKSTFYAEDGSVLLVHLKLYLAPTFLEQGCKQAVFFKPLKGKLCQISCGTHLRI